MDHAILSPSASGRWLVCNRAARLELQFPDEESDFAKEGTLAHSIAEVLLKSGEYLLTIDKWKYFKEQEFYSEAMYEHVQDFVNYIYEHKNPNVKNWHSPERKVDLSAWVPEGFGHIDDPFVAGNVLHIFDLKFGKGVQVSAQDNSQLKIYALGMLDELEAVFDIDEVHLHIYQPRLNNIDKFVISVEDLKFWGNTVLIPAARLAFDGEGEFVAGDHCHFCRARHQCRALADYNLELAKLRFEDYSLLNDDELMQIFAQRKIFESWIKAVSDFALAQALKGKQWPGYKVVEGRSNRKYKDEDKIAKILLDKLYISNMHKPKELLNLEDMQKLLGKESFDKYIVPNLIKPPGQPALVPLSDDRPVFKDAAKAFTVHYEEDFMN